MTTAADWYHGARPRTLPAAIAPVALGTALGYWHTGEFTLLDFAALVVALALQVGVNYANDYSDGIRGTDSERVGPVRLVGQGLAEARVVKRAAFVCFGVAACAGLAITVTTQKWIFIPLGLLAIVSAWFYTGGRNPYGYAGLGEVFVFVWFGLAAVLGTVYLQVGSIVVMDFLLATASGAFACALLVVNNLRDIPGDSEVGKRTLAVRIGDARTRDLYTGLMIGGTAIGVVVGMNGISGNTAWPASGFAAVAALPALVPAIRKVRSGALGRDLITVLAATGRTQMLWATAISIAMIAEKSLH